MAGAILVSMFGCENGLVLSGARVYHAMAHDGLFLRRAGTLNRNGVPAFSLGLQAVWASLLTLSGSYGQLLDYVVFAALLFYVLTVGGVFVLRVRRPDLERPVRVFAYPVLPALYLVGALAIMGALLVYKPAFTWPGIVLVLVGLPLYFLNRRSAPSPAPGTTSTPTARLPIVPLRTHGPGRERCPCTRQRISRSRGVPVDRAPDSGLHDASSPRALGEDHAKRIFPSCPALDRRVQQHRQQRRRPAG